MAIIYKVVLMKFPRELQDKVTKIWNDYVEKYDMKNEVKKLRNFLVHFKRDSKFCK